MIADILQRVSTKKQSDEEKTGLKRQNKHISTWLEENTGYEVRNTFEVKDSAFVRADQSSKKTFHEKGEFNAYMESLRDGSLTAPDVLIVDDFTRLSRLPLKKARKFVEELSDLGITIVTASDRTAYKPDIHDSVEGLFGLIFRLDNAHKDSERKSNHIRAAKLERRNNAVKGERLKIGNPPKWLEIDENDQFKLLPHRAEAVKLIFELVNSGMSKGGASRELNKREISGWDRNGNDTLGKWDSTKVSRIINSRSVTGDHVSRTWKQDGTRADAYMWTVEANDEGFLIKNAYPPIVSEAAWLTAQAKRDVHFQNLAKKPRASVNDGRSILAIANCGMCGSTMRYKASSLGAKYAELICSSKAHSGSCVSSSMNHSLAEEAVIRLLFDFDGADLSVLFEKNDSTDLIKAEINELQTEIEVLQARIKAKKGKVSSEVVLLLDDKETELAEKQQELTKTDISDYSNLVKNWRDVLDGDVQQRVKCAEFIKAVCTSIEFESIKRGKKIIRIQSDAVGQIFAVIEKREINMFRGTWT